MCQSDDRNSTSAASKSTSGSTNSSSTTTQQTSTEPVNNNSQAAASTMNEQKLTLRRRRDKRDKDVPTTTNTTPPQARRKPPHHHDHHKKENATSSAVVAILPSLAGVIVLGMVLAGRSGFRGRPSVCGVDLGTTNSVICVRHQNGTVQCIPDEFNNEETTSVIVPSVVSFLEPHERPVGPSTKVPSPLFPHPSQTIVGRSAKKRIDSHPHHTVYNAKRILGKSYPDPAVQALASEVEFAIFEWHNASAQSEDDSREEDRWAAIRVPDDQHGHYQFRPHEIGGYVLTHLRNMVSRHLGHDNVRSAVICVPAKFTPAQRQHTVHAYQLAGFHVIRIIEEPTAAALAYGLHRKPDVDYILVYDFGGGTLDVSLLHVSEGFVDVLGVDGDDRLGGADFDSAIARYFVQQPESKQIVERVRTGLRAIQLDVTDEDDILAAQCPKIQEPPLCTVSAFHTLGERIKIKLSENYFAHENEDNYSVTAECWGLEESSMSSFHDLPGFCAALKLQTLSLTRLQFSTLAQPLFDRSLAPVKRLLQDLDVDDVDEIVMVGGTTRMPQIRSLVAQQFPGKPLNVHIDPDITVAYGAASVVD